MLKHMMFSCGAKTSGAWAALYSSGNSYDDSHSAAIAPDGSVYVVGIFNPPNDSYNDSILTKFSSSGTVQWHKTLGGSKIVHCYSVAVAPDGSVYVCGETDSCGAGLYDLLLIKFSSSGTVQWQKTLGGSNSDRGESVAVAPDGSVYVCGYTELPAQKKTSFLLTKFSSSGTVQWQKAFVSSDSNTSSIGKSVAVSPDGSVYVCGYISKQTSPTSAYRDLFLAKFSSSGTVQWQKTLGGARHDYGISVAVAPDGSVYACGITESNYQDDGLLVKFSSSGTVQWQKTFGGSSYDDAGRSVAVAQDGSVYVCGDTESAGAGSQDILLTKFSSSGTVQWKKTLGCSKFDFGRSICVAPDGSVYIYGLADPVGKAFYKWLLIKITDFLLEKGTVIFGDFTFQDVSLTVNNASLTSASSSLSVSNAGLTVTTPSLIINTVSLPIELYTL